jgi:undecaprenyl pyrophosphate phosphatase UppP
MTIASALTFMDQPAAGSGFVPMLVGVIAAFGAGYASIGVFMKLLQENRLYYFAVYCIVAGSIFPVLTRMMGY